MRENEQRSWSDLFDAKRRSAGCDFPIECRKQLFPLLCWILFVTSATADVIRLRNGKILRVERAWQEGDQVRYERNGNTFGFSKELVERIESGPYHPDARDIESSSATGSHQSVPVEVVEETLNLGGVSDVDDPGVVRGGQLDQTRLL